MMIDYVGSWLMILYMMSNDDDETDVCIHVDIVFINE